MIEVFAPAKVNLTLHITGKRNDGYHLLDSLVVFCDVGDRITLSKADTLTLSVTGPFAKGVPIDETNLLCQAARLLDPTGGAAITLDKHLPHGAGIGGGSSDAAAALYGLSQLWDVPLPADTARLGADVPVCMAAPQAMQMQGIGEILTPVDLPPFWLVLVNPGRPVSTRLAFEELSRNGETDNAPMSRLPPAPDFDALVIWLADQRNDLTPIAMSLVPEIERVIAALWNIDNCADADMSGSGSTCRGIFETEAEARDAAAQLSEAYPDWWVRAGAVS